MTFGDELGVTQYDTSYFKLFFQIDKSVDINKGYGFC